MISLLPRSYAPQKSPPGALQLTAANGSTIATYGQHVLTIDLGLRRAFAWAFTVADVRSAIIGADFLAHHGLVVDIRRQRITDVATPCFAEGTTQRAALHGIYVVSPAIHATEELQPRLDKLLSEFGGLFQPSSAPKAGRSFGSFRKTAPTPRREVGRSKARFRPAAVPWRHSPLVQPMGQPSTPGPESRRRMEIDGKLSKAQLHDNSRSLPDP